MKPIALFDLDGTLADFDGAMRKHLAALASPSEPVEHLDTAYRDLPHMTARRRLVKSLPGFWRDLAPLDCGMALVKLARECGFTISILTRGPRETGAWKEKVEWVEKHLPDVNNISIVKDKSLVYGRVLVDDWPSYYMKWLKYRPRGYVLVPAQPWNEDAESPKGGPAGFDGRIVRVTYPPDLHRAKAVFEKAKVPS